MTNQAIATDIRRSILHMMHASKSSHIGSCFSLIEILVALYFNSLNIDPNEPQKWDRDTVILSKAHASAALYATLAHRGFFPCSYLERYYIDGGLLPGHLDKTCVPGIETSGGSLGHGLSLGIGMAMAHRLDQNSGKIFVILGDGECNEGSVWEAIMLASTLKLATVTAIVDYNKIQSFGRTNEIINQTNIAQRWESFGWEVYEANGHSIPELIGFFDKPQQGPKVIIAHTVKGKGVSFMEDNLAWHYKSPNDAQLAQALKELE